MSSEIKFDLFSYCKRNFYISLTYCRILEPPFLGVDDKNHTSDMTHMKITGFNHGHAPRL